MYNNNDSDNGSDNDGQNNNSRINNSTICSHLLPALMTRQGPLGDLQ